MVYRDYIEADGVYQDAQRSNQSDHGWDFRPEPKRSPSSFLIVALAVGLVVLGIAFVGAAQAL